MASLLAPFFLSVKISIYEIRREFKNENDSIFMSLFMDHELEWAEKQVCSEHETEREASLCSQTKWYFNSIRKYASTQVSCKCVCWWGKFLAFFCLPPLPSCSTEDDLFALRMCGWSSWGILLFQVVEQPRKTFIIMSVGVRWDHRRRLTGGKEGKTSLDEGIAWFFGSFCWSRTWYSLDGEEKKLWWLRKRKLWAWHILPLHISLSWSSFGSLVLKFHLKRLKEKRIPVEMCQKSGWTSLRQLHAKLPSSSFQLFPPPPRQPAFGFPRTRKPRFLKNSNTAKSFHATHRVLI